MSLSLPVSPEDHLKLCLGHLVLRNIRRDPVGYRSYREENVSKGLPKRDEVAM